MRKSIQASHMSGRESRVRWEQAADGELQRNRQIKAPCSKECLRDKTGSLQHAMLFRKILLVGCKTPSRKVGLVCFKGTWRRVLDYPRQLLIPANTRCLSCCSLNCIGFAWQGTHPFTLEKQSYRMRVRCLQSPSISQSHIARTGYQVFVVQYHGLSPVLGAHVPPVELTSEST